MFPSGDEEPGQILIAVIDSYKPSSAAKLSFASTHLNDVTFG
jgi:hypothetical protein